MKIILGLGNPGREYEKTRHNVGYMALDALADKLGARIERRGFRCVYGEARIGTERVVLAKPETYMNASGFAAVELLNWFKPDIGDLIVIYDDIDLPCGALRIRANGSAGTHNGMRSIVEQLGSEDFPRIRIGIGKPAHGLVDHVLGVPSEEDAKAIASALPSAADAAMLIARGRIDEAQTQFNYKPPKKEKPPKRERSEKSGLTKLSGAHGDGDCKGEGDDLPVFGRETVLFRAMRPCAHSLQKLPYSLADVIEAENRLARFAPLIKKLFPETEGAGGIIESPLLKADKLKSALEAKLDLKSIGGVFIKLDSALPVAGSVKARGGIYEVLCHAEELALKHRLITEADDYSRLAEHREFFSNHTVQVGSTGNLGLSIGISASAIGFKTIVHMSADAKQWKKALLRSRGVTVIEYEGDYGEAVKRGRALSDADEKSYFVDDENSVRLFMGYAVAALRLKKQLEDADITVDTDHPLFVYLPCGVGGAPGGITFGLKLVFGDSVRCIFVEPVNAPCMLAALIKHECIHISELGLSGKTDADGLAVGRASKLVYDTVGSMIDGEVTVSDARLKPLVQLVHGTERVFIEPSAATSVWALAKLAGSIADGAVPSALQGRLPSATHILWATGGGLVPEAEREKYVKQ
ncbi:MAG: D-serine ammonia-lyase [Clostridia bacterium]|nr:D-serine ammonia-lyase [Clostridia bacterium]